VVGGCELAPTHETPSRLLAPESIQTVLDS